MIAIGPLVALYLAFAAKHLLADYYLQTAWMALGKERAEGWIAPLVTHAGIHAAATLVIVLAVRPSFWWLALVDFLVHGAIDRCKGLIVRRLRLSLDRAGFWWAIGTDQTLHQLTHFAYVIVLLVA
ncbi:MAG: DUF3307 domain-containing protein [Propylenella sp.]